MGERLHVADEGGDVGEGGGAGGVLAREAARAPVDGGDVVGQVRLAVEAGGAVGAVEGAGRAELGGGVGREVVLLGGVEGRARREGEGWEGGVGRGGGGAEGEEGREGREGGVGGAGRGGVGRGREDWREAGGGRVRVGGGGAGVGGGEGRGRGEV